MTERPILFSAPMVRAIIDGTKTQTRRVLKTEPVYDGRFAGKWKLVGKKGHEAALCSPTIANLCPYGQPGDRLWVREAWAAHPQDSSAAFYRATVEAEPGFPVWSGPWRPSIHMPRWASRITLEITRVRVERLQDISRADAMAEGIRPFGDSNGWHVEHGIHYMGDPEDSYFSLWEAINGPGSVESNPWVWVVEFRMV